MHLATPDFRVDLSLHLLSVLVSGAIALALLWHLVVLLSPMLDFRTPTDSAQTAELGYDEAGPPAWAAAEEFPAAAQETLPPPRAITHFTVFRCVANGDVTYTDRPCERGGMRVLRLPRN
jgi:hypothetical protein